MKVKLESYLKKIISLDCPLERSADMKFGDYASNIAFRISKALKKPPMEVAGDLVLKIKEVDKGNFFDEVEAAAPGFINFWVKKEVFFDSVLEVVDDKGEIASAALAMTDGQKKVNLEFVSANPTGPLTMANGRGGFLGHTLANVLSMAGYDVTREYYINDAGVQVRKLGASILAALKLMPDSPDHYQGEYVKELAEKMRGQITKKQKNKKTLEQEEVGRLAAKELLASIKKSLKNVAIKHDVWFSEYKELRKKRALEKTLELLRSRGMVYERDGAVWMRTVGELENGRTKEKENIETKNQEEIASQGLPTQGSGQVAMTERGDDKDRVLIKSDGEATYFLGDLAYHYNKFIERKFDKAIVIWGADHHGYVGRVRSGVAAMGVDPEHFQAIITQLIRLVRDGEEVKMSKRAGEFITLDDLVKEVGKDAARFFFLMHAPDTHMDFDLNLAKERSVKNPVYYAQYALVRCYGIMRKARIKNKESGIMKNALELLKEESEIRLIKELAQFEDVIIQTAKDFQAHRLIKYALELAKAMHNFYDKERVIILDENLMNARLALVFLAKNIFERLFDVIGISKLKKM